MEINGTRGTYIPLGMEFFKHQPWLQKKTHHFSKTWQPLGALVKVKLLVGYM